jgi:DNA-binding NarL/FixJ family response regulator
MSTPPQTTRVLVVDDHEVVRQGLLTVLVNEPDRRNRRADSFSELTARELDVLRLVAVGEPNKRIAREPGISERTARTHVSRILQKLSLSSRTQAALWAVREGLVELDAPRHGR